MDPVPLTYKENTAILAVPWKSYSSTITGGTGKFAGASGHLDYFGIVDLVNYTLVLRYSGEVCFANPSSAVMK